MAKPKAAAPAKTGAPRVEIDPAQLKAIMRLKPTPKDVSSFFECSEDTIVNRIHDLYSVTFSEFRDQHMVKTRFDLIRSALTRAEKSDLMLIFCLKNLCDWKNESNEELEKLKADLAELLKQISDLKDKT